MRNVSFGRSGVIIWVWNRIGEAKNMISEIEAWNSAGIAISEGRLSPSYKPYPSRVSSGTVINTELRGKSESGQREMLLIWGKERERG